ncbi:MAG: EamA family transporter, partial [Terriglobia bacterium]
MADASPLLFILVRFALASVLLLFLFGRRTALWDAGLARAGAVAGFFLAAGYAFQTTGLQYTTPAKSAFITALSVALVPLLVVLVFRHRLRAWTVAGVAAAAGGLYFLTVPPGELTIARGDLLTFFCALAFAGHIVAVGHFAPRLSVSGLIIWQVVAALGWTAMATPLLVGMGLEEVKWVWTPRLALALVVTAALATALAFSLQTWAQRLTSSTHTAIIFSLEPVFAALTS